MVGMDGDMNGHSAAPFVWFPQSTITLGCPEAKQITDPAARMNAASANTPTSFLTPDIIDEFYAKWRHCQSAQTKNRSVRPRFFIRSPTAHLITAHHRVVMTISAKIAHAVVGRTQFTEPHADTERGDHYNNSDHEPQDEKSVPTVPIAIATTTAAPACATAARTTARARAPGALANLFIFLFFHGFVCRN